MIEYIKGDLFTALQKEDLKTTMIAHVVNDVGKWGAGFTKALSNFDPHAERLFKKAWRFYLLGEVQFCYGSLQSKTCLVANMFAQHGVGINQRRIRYDSLVKCMSKFSWDSIPEIKTILCPMLGCGLGGGDPIVVKALLQDFWGEASFNVKVFSL